MYDYPYFFDIRGINIQRIQGLNHNAQLFYSDEVERLFDDRINTLGTNRRLAFQMFWKVRRCDVFSYINIGCHFLFRDLLFRVFFVIYIYIYG